MKNHKFIYLIVYLGLTVLFVCCKFSKDRYDDKIGCIGNCVNGQGTMVWENSNKYIGAWKSDRKSVV